MAAKTAGGGAAGTAAKFIPWDNAAGAGLAFSPQKASYIPHDAPYQRARRDTNLRDMAYHGEDGCERGPRHGGGIIVSGLRGPGSSALAASGAKIGAKLRTGGPARSGATAK